MARSCKCRYCGGEFEWGEDVRVRPRVCPECKEHGGRKPEGMGLRTQEEVAAVLKLSGPLVKQIERRALARIRGDAELRELFTNCLREREEVNWGPTAEERVRGWQMEIARWKEIMALVQEEGLMEEAAEFIQSIAHAEELIAVVTTVRMGN